MCPFCATRRDDLVAHLFYHLPVTDDGRVRCGCDRSFGCVSDLEAHLLPIIQANELAWHMMMPILRDEWVE